MAYTVQVCDQEKILSVNEILLHAWSIARMGGIQIIAALELKATPAEFHSS